MGRLLPYRRRSADGAPGLYQIGGRIRLGAVLTDISILVGSATEGTCPANEPIGKKALIVLAVILLYLAALDVARGFEPLIDQLGVMFVLRRVRGPEEVELNVEVS